jgi:hypothetical protein
MRIPPLTSRNSDFGMKISFGLSVRSQNLRVYSLVTARIRSGNERKEAARYHAQPLLGLCCVV